jgi:hypothetical protein
MRLGAHGGWARCGMASRESHRAGHPHTRLLHLLLHLHRPAPLAPGPGRRSVLVAYLEFLLRCPPGQQRELDLREREGRVRLAMGRGSSAQ